MDLHQLSVNELAQVCARSANAAEWEEFLRRATPLASLVAVRVARLWAVAPTQALVDDIVQEVFVKLCDRDRRILRDFVPRVEDSFMGLLRIVATSVANDYFRRLHSTKRGGKVVTSPLAGEQAPASANGSRESGRLHASVLFAQLDQMLRDADGAISERDRAIFWLYYRQGFTAQEIATLPAVDLTPKGVESAVRRVAIWLRNQVQKRSPNREPATPARLSPFSEGKIGPYPLEREQP